MYRNNFIVALQDLKGNTLRETQAGSLFLPFGTEYKILFKNKSFQRAVVSLFIDGTDALGGSQIVVNAQAKNTLERFILDGDLYKGRRFKFVDPKTDGNVQDPSSPMNGIVRVVVQYEKRLPEVLQVRIPWTYYHTPDSALPNTYFTYRADSSGDVFMSNFTQMSVAGDVPIGAQCGVTQNRSVNVNSAHPGETVEGSDSNQTFYNVSVGELEDKKTIFQFRLLGRTETPEADPVVLLPTKEVFCAGCGIKVKWDENFCKQCGRKLDHRDG